MLIQLVDITIKYQYDDSAIIEGLSVDIGQGVTTLLIDCQGGKSSIARALTRHISLSGGSILYNGINIQDIPHQDMNMVLLPNKMLYYKGKSVLFNIAYPLILRKVHKKVALDTASHHLQQLGLCDLIGKKYQQLSQQELTSLALARATIRHNKVAILDSYLDNIEQDNVQQTIDTLSKSCDNIINITSDVNKAVGQIILISDNQVVAQGNKADIYRAMKDILWLQAKIERNYE